MKPITFCVATAKNEKDYIHLLLTSLIKNTDINVHEVLVFVDSDNQGTYESLIERKKEIPNLKIYRNTLGFPIGGQRNISIMFAEAKNKLVCNLHSDMVVGKDFDKYISESMTGTNIFLSCTRIEPPLHPPDYQKIVMDFGITPVEFKWEEFNTFVEKLQSENRLSISAYSVPFVIDKDAYFNLLGGFDTQFRCSSEDHDFMIRLEQNGFKSIQIWNACVYHFTCVSSRGKDWYKQNDEIVSYNNRLQQYADIEEKKRFIRKWGFFGRTPRPVYDIALFVDMDEFVDVSLLEYVEPYFTKLYINDSSVKDILTETVKFKSSYYANLKWGYTPEFWKTRNHLFEKISHEDRILFAENIDGVNNDSIMSIKFSDLLRAFSGEGNVDVKSAIENSHVIIDSYEPGIYELMGLTIKIKNKKDISDSLKRSDIFDVRNTDELFIFE